MSLRLIPLLAIVVIIYNFLALGNGVVSHETQDLLNGPMVSIPMVSKDHWELRLGDVLVLFSLLLLFVEVVKATRTTSREVMNHGLSMLTFIVALIEFIVVPGFATSTFFFIMLMTLFDVVAGYTISIVAAEHDLGLGRANNE